MISFIIRAPSQASHIAFAIDSVHRAASSCGQHYEIVVANAGSSEQTRRVASERRARVVDIDSDSQAQARNAGAAAARGRVLFFMDAGIRLEEELLSAALLLMWQGAVGGGITTIVPQSASGRERAKALMLGKLLHRMKLASGSFLFCTRSAFDDVGGFNEALPIADDLALSRALSRKGRFVPLKHPLRNTQASPVEWRQARAFLLGKTHQATRASDGA